MGVVVRLGGGGPQRLCQWPWNMELLSSRWGVVGLEEKSEPAVVLCMDGSRAEAVADGDAAVF